MHTQNADLREKYFYLFTCLNWERVSGHPVFKNIFENKKDTYQIDKCPYVLSLLFSCIYQPTLPL